MSESRTTSAAGLMADTPNGAEHAALRSLRNGATK
jgi:hypothetical protein